jgi:hypothetical protein
MAGQGFITLPEKLWSLAERVKLDLRNRGYTIRIEPNDVSLPGTPAFLARRDHERLYILVTEKVNPQDMDRWVRYCQSCSGDTRVAMCLEAIENVSQAEVAKFRSIGIGLVGQLEGNLNWPAPAIDLAFRAQLPDRKDLKPAVRRLLGEALDRFDQRDWRMGFESACLVLEDESREYLLKNVALGRVSYTNPQGRVVSPSKAHIRKMTLGALTIVFCNLMRQNQIEARVCAALDSLNPNRIRRIHKGRKKVAESVLRRNVGVQMWSIINALSELAAS